MIWALPVIALIGLALFWVTLQQEKGGGARPRKAGANLDREMIVTRWQSIQAGAASGGAGLKNAVMEADKLLDYAMKGSGFPGDTMGERLKSRQSSRFSDLNAIWRAHKLRNAFAHEVGADLVASQANEALRDFERGLKDLEVL